MLLLLLLQMLPSQPSLLLLLLLLLVKAVVGVLVEAPQGAEVGVWVGVSPKGSQPPALTLALFLPAVLLLAVTSQHQLRLQLVPVTLEGAGVRGWVGVPRAG
jgi:hypothetical protein